MEKVLKLLYSFWKIILHTAESSDNCSSFISKFNLKKWAATSNDFVMCLGGLIEWITSHVIHYAKNLVNIAIFPALISLM